MPLPVRQAVHGHICQCPCCALASLGASTQMPGVCQLWLPYAAQLGRAWPASSLCDRSGEVHPPSPRIILGSWQCCRFWPRHGRGLGKASPQDRISSSSLLWDLICRCHMCRVPRAQLGRGSPHTCSQKRAVCLLVELGTPPSPAGCSPG